MPKPSTIRRETSMASAIHGRLIRSRCSSSTTMIELRMVYLYDVKSRVFGRCRRLRNGANIDRAPAAVDFGAVLKQETGALGFAHGRVSQERSVAASARSPNQINSRSASSRISGESSHAP